MIGMLTTKASSNTSRMFAIFFIPIIVVHLAWITPVVEWSCLCPEDEQNHQCCCNCPKCVKNRGGFKSFCHLRPDRIEEPEIAKGSSVADLLSKGTSPDILAADRFNEHGELSICQCNSHIIKISLDIKIFLPQVLTTWSHLFPFVGIITTDDWWPPEAIPCHPHPPG